ncbi:arylamine N-acetyltransferase [Lunatimonas lonarensis]|uniref:Arylamine N-acetyltransferase n=1 Tax=Lunatimonas lonarensis TaxID=1232681 RepID=R7ZVH0_9BACT|nr:arylamine N-acetyltransferase [Lunatimonas lonarensis]EON78120.1 arylamine N-acetyltransferase [Lunatimonas lonarensis]
MNDTSPFFSPISPDGLASYLDRIGYEGDVATSLSCLEALHLLHPQAIPFENINPYLGLPVRLDQGSLMKKLITQGRGGYCFEHNLLFGAVLRKIGFKVRSLAARVLWQLPAGKIMPRDHMVLMVSLHAERYLVDVGWGGNTLTKPLLLGNDQMQATPHEPFKLQNCDGIYTLSIQLNGEWEPMHQFGLEEYLLPDYEVISWYLNQHPDSLFVNHLMAARTTKSERLALKDDQFTIHPTNGVTEKKRLGTPGEVLDVLQDRFGIRIPEKKALIDRLRQRVF